MTLHTPSSVTRATMLRRLGRPYDLSAQPAYDCLREEVHPDVWGPSPVTSLGGRRYYITFTNNFSRYTWATLVKTKDEAQGLTEPSLPGQAPNMGQLSDAFAQTAEVSTLAISSCPSFSSTGWNTDSQRTTRRSTTAWPSRSTGEFSNGYAPYSTTPGCPRLCGVRPFIMRYG
jgi:hypothetical protein